MIYNLISPEYLKLQRMAHDIEPSYGTMSKNLVGVAAEIIENYKAKSVLDYGCGKGELKKALGDIVSEYDPAIPGKDAEPKVADVVFCTDVLEHIEPDKLEAVLNYMEGLARKMAFLTVALIPATKTLDDGRNAHLIVKPQQWWLDALLDHWDMTAYSGTNKGFVFMGVPK